MIRSTVLFSLLTVLSCKHASQTSTTQNIETEGITLGLRCQVKGETIKDIEYQMILEGHMEEMIKRRVTEAMLRDSCMELLSDDSRTELVSKVVASPRNTREVIAKHNPVFLDEEPVSMGGRCKVSSDTIKKINRQKIEEGNFGDILKNKITETVNADSCIASLVNSDIESLVEEVLKFQKETREVFLSHSPTFKNADEGVSLSDLCQVKAETINNIEYQMTLEFMEEIVAGRVLDAMKQDDCLKSIPENELKTLSKEIAASPGKTREVIANYDPVKMFASCSGGRIEGGVQVYFNKSRTKAEVTFGIGLPPKAASISNEEIANGFYVDYVLRVDNNGNELKEKILMLPNTEYGTLVDFNGRHVELSCNYL